MGADDLPRFYELLGDLADRTGGPFRLADCKEVTWPARGVYFFFEPEEYRNGSRSDLRVVRVGTHALRTGSKSTLRGRMSQHRGTVSSGGGNHRGSVFRLLVGEALMARGGRAVGTWGHKGTASKAAVPHGPKAADVTSAEHPIEVEVSNLIRAMPFLFVGVDDTPGPDSTRGYIERNSIALLSSVGKDVDPASARWLGQSSKHDKVRPSGLWNNEHVGEEYEQSFLEVLAKAVDATGKPGM